VLDANRQKGMLTGVIRLCTPDGEGDYEHLSKVIAVAESVKARFQMGKGRTFWIMCTWEIWSMDIFYLPKPY
jgi:hypothetical protein